MFSDKTALNPHVFWLFGLSGAGKSTLASALIQNLRSRHVPVLALDGDTLRAGLCHGLGYSDSDRAENLRRAAETARLGTASRLCVVASFITPLHSHRKLITEIVGEKTLSLVHVSAPLSVCQGRDIKGLYARAKVGQVVQMTGLSSTFEAPQGADLVINTAEESIAASSARLIQFATPRLLSPIL